MKLKPSEVRFWQEVFLAFMQSGDQIKGSATGWADTAVKALRGRLDDPGPRPDEGRL